MCAKPAEERLTVFQTMADADPDNELAHFSLGKVHFELENFAEAEKALRRTLELSPKHTLARRFLGESLLRRGEKDEAVEILREAILLAHEKGEWKPRNEMTEILQGAGVEPPALPKEAADTRSPASEPAAVGEGNISCRRCGQVGAQLEEAPFPTALGKEVHDTICIICWREWLAVSIKVINEYRLNLMSPEAQEVYDNHMREFLGVESS